MSTTYSNIGLVAWTSGSDLFNHTQLANNFLAIDNHDHTAGKGLQIPTAGLQNLAVTGPKIAANAIDASKILDGSVGLAELASNSVDGSKVVDGSITLAELASGLTEPAFSSYKQAIGWYGGSTAASPPEGGYYLDPAGITSTLSPTSGSIFYIDPADYAAGSRATKFRLKAHFETNAVAPGNQWVLDLRPITITFGSSGNLNTYVPSGSPVIGSTQVYTAPSANFASNTNSADFTIPSAGLFVFYAINSVGGSAAGSRMTLRASLQVRQV